MLAKYLLLVGSVFLLEACVSENGEDLSAAGALPAPSCDTAHVTYALTVAPLLQQNCSRCHNGTFASGGVELSTYAHVRAIAADGRLLGVVSHAPGFPAMPQGAPKLSDCALGQLRQWVADGAPNN